MGDYIFTSLTLGKIAEKAVHRSVFLTTWHELTKTHSFRLFFWQFSPLGQITSHIDICSITAIRFPLHIP